MIKFLRSKGSTYFVKAILGLIILSFIPWGVSNLVQNRGQGSLVAKIGNIDISKHALLKAIENTLSQNKLKITMAEALSMGAAKTILDNQIAGAALGLEIQDLKLAIDQKTLENNIKAEAFFHNEKGAFDPNLLKNFLSSRGLSEAKLKEMVTSSLLEMQLVSPLGQGITTPKLLLEHIAKKQLEKRSFTVIRIPFNGIKAAQPPKAEDLQNYYRDHQSEFTVPEYRTFSVLILDENHLQKKMHVDEKEIKSLYHQHMEDYAVPEKRHLKVISREDKEVAAMLKKEATKTKFKGWVDLGSQTKEAVASKLESAVLKAAFSLKKGEISDPIKVGESYYMVAVEGITPKHTKSFSEARESIIAKIWEDKGAKYVTDLLKTIDDQLAGGAPLAEVAKEYDLKIMNTSNVNVEGSSLDAKPLPHGITPDMIKTAFETAQDSESPRIDMEGNTSSYVVRVTKVAPSFVKSFDEVKPTIIKNLTDLAKKEAAIKKAQEIANTINQNKAFDLKAYESKTIPVSDRFEIIANHSSGKRIHEPQENTLVKALIDGFGVPKGHALSGQEENAAIVVKVDAVVAGDPKKDPKFYDKIKEAVHTSIVHGVSEQFTNSLKDKFGLTIYKDQLEQLNSGN